MNLNVLIYLVFSMMMISSVETFAQIELLGNGDAILQAENDEPDLFFRNNAGDDVSSLCATFDGKMHILTAGFRRMTFDPSGNVGIGTPEPQSELHLFGDMRIQGSLANPNPSYRMYNTDGLLRGQLSLGDDFLFLTASDNLIVASSDELTLTSSNDAILNSGQVVRLQIGGTDQMFIDTDGDVGIGTTTPDVFKVKVVHGTYGLNLEHGGTNENDWELVTSSLENGPLRLYNNALLRGSFDGTSGAYTTSSDRRLKKNIKGLEPVLEKVMRLEATRYQFIENNAKNIESIGFIAQDVEVLFPEFVFKNEEERSKGQYTMDYTGFGILAIKAIQEQQATIENLQIENKQVITENAALAQKVNNLEGKMEELYGLVERMTTLETNLQSCCLKHQNSNTRHQEHDKPSENFQQDRAQLQQNFPNPFHQQTEIQYYLPSKVTTASLHISDLKGKVLKTYPLTGTGIGKVMLNGGQLTAGMYVYSLIIDGQLVDTKQMVLTKF